MHGGAILAHIGGTEQGNPVQLFLRNGKKRPGIVAAGIILQGSQGVYGLLQPVAIACEIPQPVQQGIKGIGIEKALARTAVLRIGIEISHGFIGGGGQAGHFLPKAVNLRLGADIALPAMLGINGQLVEGQTVIGLGTVIPQQVANTV